MKYAMLDSAIAFAATAHAGQIRRYVTAPYITHPLEVVTILLEESQTQPDEPTLISAVLHDVVEDTVVGIDSIRRRFGNDVASIVADLTEVVIEGNRTFRKNAERNRLALVEPRSQSIKVADLISNARSIVRYDHKFAAVFMVEARALHEVLTAADPGLLKLLETLLSQWEAGAR